MEHDHVLIRGEELNKHLFEHGWSNSMLLTQGDGNSQLGPYAWAWHQLQHASDENHDR